MGSASTADTVQVLSREDAPAADPTALPPLLRVGLNTARFARSDSERRPASAPSLFYLLPEAVSSSASLPPLSFPFFCILERCVVINTQIGVLTAGVGLGLWGSCSGWGWRVLVWRRRRVFGCIHQI